MTTPEVNSIQIPVEYVNLCTEWHGGKRSMMYAVSSTGGLTLTGSHSSGFYSREERYLLFWEKLLEEVNIDALRAARRCAAKDVAPLEAFERFVKKVIKQLTPKGDRS